MHVIWNMCKYAQVLYVYIPRGRATLDDKTIKLRWAIKGRVV